MSSISNTTPCGINKHWRVILEEGVQTLFQAVSVNHLWECDVSVSSSNTISVSLSLTDSPEMFLIRRLCFCRIKVGVRGWTHTSRHLGVMWPLTLDLSVCKLIRQGRCSICSVALCFEEETPGWSGEGLSPQPAHTAEHTLTQPGYN